MNNLLDRFKPKANALQNALRGPRHFQGSGQSLGGGDSHHVVIPVQLEEAGPLGMGIEKMKGSGGCIVGRVEDDSQAQRAGMRRGDVVCFAGSNGREEVTYADFLQLAKSNDRPLCFEVRRVKAVSAGAAAGAAATGTPNGRQQPQQSAEAFARKQAMIAAAEARDKANKAKLKPISRTTTASSAASNNRDLSSAHSSQYDLPDNDPKSELARAAVEAVKTQEAMTAAQLGYNPYVPNRATAGQARNATVAMTHGAMGGDTNDVSPTAGTGAGVPAPPPVRPPSNALAEAESGNDSEHAEPPPELFEEALEVLVTSAADASGSLSTIHKLVVNATTKGQQLDNPDSGKFRRVRLANPKISAAVVDPPGALDLMLSCGFVLTETDDGTNESVLVFPALSEEQEPLPAWLPDALKRMEALGRK
jgi:PUB domain